MLEMNKKARTLIGLILFVVFLAGAYLAYEKLSEARKPQNGTDVSTKETIPAPDFTVYDAEGKAVRLSDFKGKPVVLNFWASWCPPCKSEMPHFNTVYADVKNDIVFLMVDLVDGQRETQAKGQQYVQEQGFSFPVYFDTKQSAADTYGIASIPTTIFIDAAGNAVTGYQGAIDEQTLRAAIDLIR